MSIIEEKIKHLPRVKIDFDQSCVIEIQKDNLKLSEIVISIQSIDYTPGTGKSKVKIHAWNPHTQVEYNTTLVLNELTLNNEC